MERNAERRRIIGLSKERAIGLLLLAVIIWAIYSYQAQKNGFENGDIFPTVYATQVIPQFSPQPEFSLPTPESTLLFKDNPEDILVHLVNGDCKPPTEEKALVPPEHTAVVIFDFNNDGLADYTISVDNNSQPGVTKRLCVYPPGGEPLPPDGGGRGQLDTLPDYAHFEPKGVGYVPPAKEAMIGTETSPVFGIISFTNN